MGDDIHPRQSNPPDQPNASNPFSLLPLCALALLLTCLARAEQSRGYFTVAATVKLIIVLPEQKGIWVVDVLIDHKPFTTKVSNVTPVVVEWDTTKYPGRNAHAGCERDVQRPAGVHAEAVCRGRQQGKG
ncbi:MAG: hypothetical protein GW893_15995 [Armatimonadetes bacterium]|nr:hypothetical protein [Armatimonadota bacterium]